LEAAKYLAAETLRDGRPMEIRALRPDDQAELLAAVERSSAKSRYRRFFGAKRYFSDKEIAFFVNVDFVNHVALVAVVEEGGRPAIIGGGRYVVVQPGQAELAFAVVDQYQGQSIGAALLRHLITIARHAGLTKLIADVLADNIAMLKVFEKCGLHVTTRREAGIVRISLQLT
jgi:RimJ/RimL family protein N-acetyltransferase